MSEWISVEDQRPESGRKVIAAYKNEHGKWRQVFARHVERWGEVADPDSDEGVSEYSEDADEFFLVEGWYEAIENWGEYSSVRISGEFVTHWKPLDPPPAQPER